MFLKSIEEVDHIPTVEPLAVKNWFIPEDEKTLAALREYVPPCSWGEAKDGLRLGLHPRANADEPTVELVLQNVGKTDLVVRQFRGNYYDDWSFLTFNVTAPDGKTYHIHRIGPPHKDIDAPRERTLQAGERYIHVVRLNRWLIPSGRGRGFGLTNGDAPEGLFATGGEFKARATYSIEVEQSKEYPWWTGKLESTAATVTVPKGGLFGEPAGDFRLHLRQPTAKLRVGDLPDLVCDLKFVGKQNSTISSFPENAVVELDGKSYMSHREGSFISKVHELTPASEVDSWITVKPDKQWIHLRGNPNDLGEMVAIPFHLTAGLHTLRIAYTFSKAERALSNAITIDVALDGWGAPTLGMKAQLRLSKSTFEPGEPIAFELDLKNIGTKARTLTPLPFDCQLSVNGDLYRFAGPFDFRAVPVEFTPGKEATPFVRVVADSAWTRVTGKSEGSTPLRLGPGKYKLRARLPLTDMVFAESNEEAIDVALPKLDPAAKAMAIAADRIWVVNAPTREKPIPEALEVLKGPLLPQQSIFDLRLLPGDDPKKKFIVFLKAAEDGKGVPEVKPYSATLWHQPYTPDVAAAIRELLLPTVWGEEKAGLRMGLRLCQANVAAGQPLAAEIVFQNHGTETWKIAQHRFNIYDYWPDTWFEVTAPDGKKWELRKPVGEIDEADNPYVITLKRGESYIHAVRLDQWPAKTNWKGASEPIRNLFAKPGEYTIMAHYDYSPPLTAGTWTANFKSNAVKLTVKGESADEWGDASGGIKARLRLTKTKLKVGDPLAFSLDLKNTGDKAVNVSAISQICGVDVDGIHYMYSLPLSVISSEYRSGTGKEFVPFVQVTIDESWRDAKGNRLLLTPGKHKVKVDFPLSGTKEQPVVSQAVEIAVEK